MKNKLDYDIKFLEIYYIDFLMCTFYYNSD
jgi:hypothetical protein